jgi:3-methyladenine DNA glycosylase/8-oxoguanine DNA glycosylase
MQTSLAHLKKDPRFKALIKKHGLPDLAPKKNYFEALARAIVYQQLSGKAAATIFARFRALFKNPRRFPTPGEVLALGDKELRSAGLSMQKITYLRDLAFKFSDGTITPKLFRAGKNRASNDDIIAHLTAVKGIGTWTAHMFLMFTLNRLDVLPVGDLGIRKGFQIVYHLKKLPTEKDMEKLAAPWREHATVASWYLWRAADEAKIKNA